MNKPTRFKPYLVRFAIVLAISATIVGLFNEVSFILQKDKYDRAPETIQIVIPYGTAEKVEAGEDVVSIPDEMVFVIGDVLEVKNNDGVSHQLGPIWVPSGATGRLVMEEIDKLAYSCSFQTSRYLGLDVRAPTTISTRMTGLILATPTMTALIFIYSLVVFPVNLGKNEKRSKELHIQAEQ